MEITQTEHVRLAHGYSQGKEKKNEKEKKKKNGPLAIIREEEGQVCEAKYA